MIRAADGVFYLETARSSWLFRILPSGHAEHLHYGGRLFADGADVSGEVLAGTAAALGEKILNPGGGMVQYSPETGPLCPEAVNLEFSSLGKGDIRDPFVCLTYADGSGTSDFLYTGYEIRQGKHAPEGLPGALAAEDAGVEELVLTCTERETGVVLTIYYAVFPETDAIVRSAALTVPADAGQGITVNRLLSTQLDFHESGLRFTTFHGHWADEMHRHDQAVTAGRSVSEGLHAGASGSRSNPFVILSEADATEEAGGCIGVNLIYSGDHYEALSSDGFDRSRFVCGIQPEGFSWQLAPGETFETPEAVMVFSAEGFGGMSRNMHRFVRRHIVRGTWRDKARPILLNSWEANYFKFDEAKLLRQARAAKDLGIELFVLDDGWFGARDDDTSSLGDWTANRKKLPGGLERLGEKIHRMGLQFGLWVEPEMVNERSELYAKHPDWAVCIPGRAHSTGRNQMFLDLTRMEVQDHVIEEMTRVFRGSGADYIKWDMNRIFSDRFSLSLPPARQGEFGHRYILGLYRVMRTLTERFPDILFEGCASGGNRFDLGILSFFPQIWASDDTDALCRADIQRGYSYGYPMSVLGCHVSASPNHQTLHRLPMETRFAVAAFGCLGYEFDPGDLSGEGRKEIREQIAWYKEWREVFFGGSLYRLRDGGMLAVSEAPGDHRAAALLLQRENRPNRPFMELKTRGLEPEVLYHVTNRQAGISAADFGSLINMMSPVHVREGSLLQGAIDRFYRLPQDAEDQILPGSALNTCGVRLAPDFAGTGYAEGTRVFRTGDARLILFEEVKKP